MIVRSLFRRKRGAIKPRITAVGVPDFWPTAYDVNPAGFDAGYALGPLFDKLRSKPAKGKLVATIGRLLAVTYKSFGAVTTLALNGFDADAMKVARSMFENEVIAEYLRKHPELVQDYLDFIRVSMHEDFDFLQRESLDLLAGLPTETLNAINTEIGRIDARFRKKSGALKNSWKNNQLKDMAVETGREHIYRSIYRWGSGLVHGDVSVLVSGFDASIGDVDVGPSTKWTHTALMTAHKAVLCLMDSFNEEGKLGFDADVAVAVEAFKKAWKPKPEQTE